jgi:hypothetical protein
MTLTAVRRASRPAAAALSSAGTLRRAELAWIVLRAPTVLLVLWLSRDWITTHLVDPAFLTHRVIEILGTPLARGLFLIAFALVLAGLWYLAQWIDERWRYAALMAAVAAILLVLFKAAGTPRTLAAPAFLLFAANLLPERFLERLLPTAQLRRAFVMLTPGVSEVLFFPRYLACLRELWTGAAPAAPHKLVAALPAILLAAAAAALLIRVPALVGLEQALRMPANARIVANGDYNWIKIDASGEHLLVTGHGAPNILRYDLADLSRAPRTSEVPTLGAQDFAYDPAAGELYVYDPADQRLLYIDAETLALKRTAPVTGLSPGDVWTAVDAGTDTITISSEADERKGSPMLVLDRSEGRVLAELDIEAGNMLDVGQHGRLYLSFFRRGNALIAYDLRTLKIAEQVAAPERADRMAFIAKAQELLLSVPTASRILRYDALTLAPRGEIASMFGVRTLAVDEERNLLLCGSLVTGEVHAIDLASGRTIARFYLGPWLRTIELDVKRGLAFVSSNGALYELKYGHLR